MLYALGFVAALWFVLTLAYIAHANGATYDTPATPPTKGIAKRKD